MTDESHGMDPIEEPVAPVDREATVSEGAGDFTSGEGLVAFAGMVLVVDWLIFGVIANDYWVGLVALVPAIAAVVLPRVNRAAVERYHPLPLVMKVVGYTIAIVGVLVIVENIRFAGNVFDEVLGVIGALAAYAGYAMAFVGARQIKI
jgi:hypothetical protein